MSTYLTPLKLLSTEAFFIIFGLIAIFFILRRLKIINTNKIILAIRARIYSIYNACSKKTRERYIKMHKTADAKTNKSMAPLFKSKIGLEPDFELPEYDKFKKIDKLYFYIIGLPLSYAYNLMSINIKELVTGSVSAKNIPYERHLASQILFKQRVYSKAIKVKSKFVLDRPLTNEELAQIALRCLYHKIFVTDIKALWVYIFPQRVDAIFKRKPKISIKKLIERITSTNYIDKLKKEIKKRSNKDK